VSSLGVRGQYDHSLEDDVEIFPTSQFLGVDWTAVEGIVTVLTTFYLIN